VVDHYTDLGLAFPGGNAPNVAVHAARAGAAAAFLGVVGDDGAGSLIRAALEAEGVDVSRLRATSGATPAVVVRRDEAGDFRCVACPWRVLPFDPDDSDESFLAGCDLVHVASTSRAEALMRAWAGRFPLSCDFGHEAPDPTLLSLVAVAAVSRPGMADAEAAALAADLRARGPGVVVVLRGAAGVTACRGEEIAHHPAVIEAVVDTLGAGDALLGHFLARLFSGEAPASSLAEAARNAARACGHLGGFGRGVPAALALPSL